MQKTTVYLPYDLKAGLARTAAETRRSEADLIRDGIRLVIANCPPAPNTEIFISDDPHYAECLDEHLVGFGEH